MTFRFFEASTIVGANVSESSGSTSVRAIGCTASARAAASSTGGTSPRIASSSASVSGRCRRRGRYTASCSTIRAAFTSALSAIDGIEAWPLRPRTRSRNGALIFSAVAQR